MSIVIGSESDLDFTCFKLAKVFDSSKFNDECLAKPFTPRWDLGLGRLLLPFRRVLTPFLAICPLQAAVPFI